MDPSEQSPDRSSHSDRHHCHHRRQTSEDAIISFNEYIRRMFENLFRGLEQQYRQIGTNYGSGAVQSTQGYDCSFGNFGQIVNNATEFAVEMNVAQFRPEDLKVSLRNDELIIEGHQKQQRDQYGTVERHFVRRYAIPDDVDRTTLASNITGD
ncbi:unnamed protein product [Gongylonema pulchrum]|uniref:SHSP domain-containing protein n=1 Tax=Gongylonema pulchrum TaxID=637853 RepID=A0A183DHY0_9BILA|nr:unnamed protein product [Gongylonema pulchrum]